MVKDKKVDRRTNTKMKYYGAEDRIVYLKRKNFPVKKGDVFDVTKEEAVSFKDKEQFRQVK